MERGPPANSSLLSFRPKGEIFYDKISQSLRFFEMTATMAIKVFVIAAD
jgi:hypothetical protein